MEIQNIPDWVLKLGFWSIDWLSFDWEKSFNEQENNEEVIQLVYWWEKDTIVKTTTFYATKLKIEDKFFYIWWNLESQYFPRGIFQKAKINITLNGVGKFFIVTIVKSM